jgi:SAM-dependent methyltransferase
MDAEQLDFPDGSFSVVLCGFGVMFMPHLDHALSEFRRVLQPGGVVGISTWKVAQSDDAGAVLDQFGLRGSREPGWITDPNTLADLLRRASFSAVAVSADAHAFRYADLDQYWRTARSTGLRRSIDSLDPDQTARVRAALAERLQPSQRDGGLYVEAIALMATARRL